MKAENLLVFTLTKDEKLNLRLPRVLKQDLKREARQKGFGRKLSAYVLSILLDRGKS